MTVRNVPDVKSSIADDAALRRSIDFGVNTIIGRWASPRACRRSRWK